MLPLTICRQSPERTLNDEFWHGKRVDETTPRTSRRIIFVSRQKSEPKARRPAAHAGVEDLHRLVESAPDLIARYDMQGRILYVNPAVERSGPLSAKQLRGRTVAEVSPKSPSARRFHDCVLHVARTGQPSEVEVIIDPFDANPQKWHHVRFVGERDQQGNLISVLGIGRDVTEQRLLQRALLNATYREQQRLGSVLHDGLAQDLTGLALMATSLASSSRNGNAPATESLDLLARIASAAITTCRSVFGDLSPIAEVRGGLVQALRDMATLYRKSYGVNIRFEAIEAARIRLPPDAIDHLFRIVQQAATNAATHANAATIKVVLTTHFHSVRVEITDDGVGLPPPVDGSNGLGLRIMHHRVSLIGGNLTIDPGRNGGTRVVCECPQPGLRPH